MAVITISRQHGSGGAEVATRVCEILGYRYFDKTVMAQVASEVGLSENEIVDFSEEKHKVRNFLDRLLYGPRVVAQVRTWKQDTTGALSSTVEALKEPKAIAMVRCTIEHAYTQDNIVIVGRGGQAILQDKPGVLHVRIEAPWSFRIQRIVDQGDASGLAIAEDIVQERDKAAADYLKRFHNINWEDPILYHMVINAGKWHVQAMANLIVNAVSNIPPRHEGE